MIWLIVLFFVVGAALTTLGHYLGYKRGVWDTEERWHNAVTRAEYDRRNQ